MRELTERDKALIIDGIPESNLALFCPALHGRGATLYDRSRNANHGTITAATWGRTPRGISYLSYDGIISDVVIPHATSLAIVGDLAIELWIKPTNFADFRCLVFKGLTGNPEPYDYYLTEATGIPQLLRGDGTLSAAVAGTIAPTAGVWNLIGASMVGVNVTHLLNGATNGSGVLVTTIGDGAHNVHLGIRPDGVTKYVGGRWGERILASGLTLAKHQQRYTRERHLFGV